MIEITHIMGDIIKTKKENILMVCIFMKSQKHSSRCFNEIMKRKHSQAHTYAEKQNNSLHIVVIKTKKHAYGTCYLQFCIVACFIRC